MREENLVRTVRVNRRVMAGIASENRSPKKKDSSDKYD